MNLPSPPTPSAGYDCLILSDQEVVRTMLKTCLKTMGLRVFASETAREAVALMRQGGHRFSLGIVACSVADVDAGPLTRRLAESGRVDQLLAYGVDCPEGDASGVRHLPFPVDFADLYYRVKQWKVAQRARVSDSAPSKEAPHPVAKPEGALSSAPAPTQVPAKAPVAASASESKAPSGAPPAPPRIFPAKSPWGPPPGIRRAA